MRFSYVLGSKCKLVQWRTGIAIEKTKIPGILTSYTTAICQVVEEESQDEMGSIIIIKVREIEDS